MNCVLLIVVILFAVADSIKAVPIYEQCAGIEWGGIFKKCDEGLVCYARSIYYSNCRPPNQCPSHWACTVVESASTMIPPPKIIPINGKCDNTSYTVCTSGSICFRRTVADSECRSQCPAGWQCEMDVAPQYEQCGGEGYIGLTRCAPGLSCFYRSKWYAQCLALCPGLGWMC